MTDTSNKIPEGWTAAPIFPTKEMTRAGIMALNRSGNFHQAVQVIAVYQAMISASPDKSAFQKLICPQPGLSHDRSGEEKK